MPILQAMSESPPIPTDLQDAILDVHCVNGPCLLRSEPPAGMPLHDHGDRLVLAQNERTVWTRSSPLRLRSVTR